MNMKRNVGRTIIAAGGLALGLAGGLFAGVGIAAAETAPDSGSYDELLNIVDDDGFQSYINASYPADASNPGGPARP